MHPIIRNIAAFLIGFIVGGFLNWLTITYLSPMFGVPEGVDPNDFDSIKAHIQQYEWKHFVAPFAAHCVGSLSGAFICSKVAAKYHLGLSLGIAFLFIIPGAAMIASLNSPMWFNVLDLVVAYFPMAYLGWVLAGMKK